jgi:hypothetical protein
MIIKTLIEVEHDDYIDFEKDFDGNLCSYFWRIINPAQAVPNEQKELAELIEESQYGLQFGDGSMRKGRSLTVKEKRLIIDALLASQPPAAAGQVVPDGYVLLPKPPTAQMREAFEEVYNKTGYHDGAMDFNDAYSAMVATAAEKEKG